VNSVRSELDEGIAKTPVELQAVVMSIDTRAQKVEEKSECPEIPKEVAAVANVDCKDQGHKEWESGVERRMVTTEEVAVKSSRTKKRPRGRRMAAGRRVKPMKLVRGDSESRKKLVAACRKVFRRATVAWRKRTILRDIRTQGNC
jgi:hypothetical protein